MPRRPHDCRRARIIEPLESRRLLTGDFGLAFRIGAVSADAGAEIVTDNAGNVFVAGNFTGSVDFNPDPAFAATLVSKGGTDVFVARYDSAGHLLWVRSAGGSQDDTAGGLAVDAAGNVVVTGGFRGSANFGPAGGPPTLSSAGDTDVFLWKMNEDGVNQVVQRRGGGGADFGDDVAVDNAGNIYVTGDFFGTVDFDAGAGTTNLSSAGNADAFLFKTGNTGALTYARRFGGTGADAGNDLVVDGTSNTYLTGSFRNTADFNPGAGTANLTSAGNGDVFVVKLNASGNFVFARRAGAGGNDEGNDIRLGSAGRIFVAGAFSGTVDFDPGTGTTTLTSAGGTDAFVWKLTNSGAFTYARRLGGSGNDLALGLAVDAAGAVYTTGRFSGTVDFNPSSTANSNLTSAGGTDAFVSKLTAGGHFVYARRLGGAGASDAGVGIAVTPNAQHVFTTGAFSGTADFNPGPGTNNLTSAGSSDAFVSRLDQAAPDFASAFRVGGDGGETPRAVASDAAGNAYVAGHFSAPSFDLDPGPGTTNVSKPAQSFFLASFYAKYTPAGTLAFGGDLVGDGTADVFINDIAPGPDGSVHLAGTFGGTVDFNPGDGTSNLTAGGFRDAFLVKLNSSGGFVYARRVGGTSDTAQASITGIAVDPSDPSGNTVYLTGSFNETADFNPGGAVNNLTSAGGFDAFVLKLNGGNYVYARRLGAGAAGVTAVDIGVDAAGNVYTTGTLEGSADFDPGAGTATLTSAGGIDVYVSKLTSAGGFAYARRAGGTGTDLVAGLAVDAAGNAHTTGRFAGAVDFNPGLDVSNLVSVGPDDAFVWKLTSAGNFTWARRLDATSRGVAVDGAGRVYVTGSFTGTKDFDPQGGVSNLTATGFFDAFTVSLDGGGNFRWARRIAGGGAANTSSQGAAITVGGGGYLYTVGTFAGTMDFDPGAGTANRTSTPNEDGAGDVFVSKLLV